MSCHFLELNIFTIEISVRILPINQDKPDDRKCLQSWENETTNADDVPAEDEDPDVGAGGNPGKHVLNAIAGLQGPRP
ncbi:hypothetical protein DERP_000181 [Dermatophagoides pteronyssinus]|uniref:Uncharacterized protein n=1 Tax=Dermatophagoides pteronyssinus TaxID=6956 RepID=A0ABQ8IZS0_DERPT|nr:hypothetical protein DERP_000181 [Dermatophagoides pteronyssinus]